MMDKQAERAEGTALPPVNKRMNAEEMMPRDGILYALCRGKVIYEKITREMPERSAELMADPELLELHVFDDQTEYRCLKLSDAEMKMVISDDEWIIWREGRCEALKGSGGKEERLYDDSYTEIVCTECKDSKSEPPEKIAVINYIKYDENDMIRFINYRYSTDVSKSGKKRAGL